jgi:hypothetical protein
MRRAERLDLQGGAAVRRLLRPIAFVLVALYFAVDAAFVYVTRPLVEWLGKLRAFSRIRAWIVSLNAYSALALFAVPVMVLEPVKPLAAYLIATGHLVSGLGTLVGAEILKLTMVERLFHLNRDKLLSIRAFAWGYGYWRRMVEWVQASKAWRMMVELKARVAQSLRSYLPRRKTMSWRSGSSRPPQASPRGRIRTERNRIFEPSTANVSRK